ncbi:hypothetical protein GO495_17605 [Chitinophaga oryziterrae]|uniref:Uncharacterized protein n=1 Tax=Chitinophaga oryziterrae TaxID=1031224 RepID=A0A6N8JB72_9BACT|nr:hypothetical protein [Chitinophaga oryziterrae]MVT42413.1 hypothetical protein [Chitinophaga oryziterrae]
MQRNLYFRTLYKRQNKVKEFILTLFLSLSSYPRLVLEVFLRKNMGERYFSTAAAVMITVILALYPVMGDLFTAMLPRALRGIMGGYGKQASHFWAHYTTWYLFLAAFVYFSFQRWKEVKRNPSVFDFGRFSLTPGDIYPGFYDLRLFGVTPNTRAIETVYEPMAAFLLGLFLYTIGQNVGGLLMLCGIIYALSYSAAYQKGDHFVMDTIDEQIVNEEMENAFIGGSDSSQSRGVRFYARKPTHEELRRKVAEGFFERSLMGLRR